MTDDPAEGTTSGGSCRTTPCQFQLPCPRRARLNACVENVRRIWVSTTVPAKGTTSARRCGCRGSTRFNYRAREGHDAHANVIAAHDQFQLPCPRRARPIDCSSSSIVISFNYRAREGHDRACRCFLSAPKVSTTVPAKGTTSEGARLTESAVFQLPCPRRARPAQTP